MPDEKQQAVQWLCDGAQLEAASILERCDVLFHHVDITFEIGGERQYEMIDVEIRASRLDRKAVSQDPRLDEQIKGAFQEVLGTQTVVRQVLWSGKADVGEQSGAEQVATATLEVVDSPHVRSAWRKALERRNRDPDGAITAARTLLESVCKHILDVQEIAYDRKADLPKLYGMAARSLNLAAEQHADETVKRILGGCHAVVDGLAALRNLLSDAHGKGREGLQPSALHAELAVNLAGSMAAFLIGTREQRANL